MTARAHSRVSARPPQTRARKRPVRSHTMEPLEARIAPAAASLSVTKVGVFAPGGDINGDGKFQPGDTILYTVTITNNGGVDLSGVTFNDIIDPNTTLGAVNVSPIALDDTFTAVANTLLEVGVTHGSSPAAQVAGNVFANDTDFLGDTFTAKTLQSTAFSGGTATAASAQAGSVTMNTNGTFTYLPAPGFTGTDTFTYTISDKGLDGIPNNADDLTSTGTVTITVGAQKVWYVDSSYNAGTNGPSDGRSNHPFTSLAPLNVSATDPDGSGDIIYVRNGSGANYTGGIALEGSESLQGEGDALSVGGFTLQAAGTRPTIVNAAGSGVTLGSGNALHGFNLGTSSAAAITGTNFGTLTIDNININSTGAALNLDTGTIAGTGFGTTTGTNVNLVTLAGTLHLGGGTLSNTAGDVFRISGGAATIDYSGSITEGASGAGHSVSIVNKTAGIVTLSGAVSDSGTGIVLSNNSTAAIHFSGGVNVTTTGANKAFSATGSGTIDVTGANNTLSSATGIALEVQNNTISATGLTFKSISAGAAPNGIILNNSGSGFLTVTGDGASDTANTTKGQITAKLGGGTLGLTSGGTITAPAGAGVSLINTGVVTLRNMQITNGNDGVASISDNLHDGINASTVAGLILDNVKITGFADNYGIHGTNVTGLSMQHVEVGNNATTSGVETPDIWNVRFDNLTGAASVLNSTFHDTRENVFAVMETAATVANLTVTNSEFRDTAQLSPGNDGLHLETTGTSQLSATVTNSTFLRNRSGGFVYNANGSSGGGTITINNNSFEQTQGTELAIAHQGLGKTVHFSIHGNQIRQQAFTAGATSGVAVSLLVGGLSNSTTLLEGTFQGNFVGNSANLNSGSLVGAGVVFQQSGAGTLTTLIDNNKVRQIKQDDALWIISTNSTGVINATISNNDLRTGSDTVQNNLSLSGLDLVAGALATDTGVLNANIVNNNIAFVGANNYFGVSAVTSAGNPTINLQGYGGPAGTPANQNASSIQTFLAGRATTVLGTPGTPALSSVGAGTIKGIVGPVALPTTPLIFEATPGDTTIVPATGNGGTSTGSTGTTTTTTTTTGAGTTSVIVDDGVLTQAELNTLVDAAIARWEATGLTAAQSALLHSVQFSVADLPGWYLGEAQPGHVILDVSAAGNSWFIDPTPNDDSEFSGAGTKLSATSSGGAAGRVDALTTVVHELGHQLGLDDTYADGNSGDIMYGLIHQGERRLPGAHEALGATPHLTAGSPDFAVGPINIGSLPVGKSVRVDFTAQINANDSANTITNQGTASSNETGNVLTDDPSVVGTANPTVTAVDVGSLKATLDGSGNLNIADLAGVNDSLTIVKSGSNIVISDPVEKFQPFGSGTISNGGHTLTIPISAVTGSITFDTNDGNDQLTLDLSGGNFINAAGLDFHGGNPTVTPGDKLVITGGAQGTVTYNYTNAHDGSVVMSNFGTVRYTGLEPVTNSGTATDVVFNLPGIADNGIFLEDNGTTPADGMLRLRSANSTFEQTDFALPTGSLTLNLGANAQTLTLSATPQFTSALTINGGTGDDTINLNSAITFAANKNLNVDLQDDDPNPGIDIINVSAAGNYILSGSGAVTFKTSKNIQILGHIATQDGNILMEANQQAIPTAAGFIGININGASAIVESTGTGAITLKGKGGNQTSNHGVQVINLGSTVRGGSVPGGDSVTIVGEGVAGVSSIGAFIPNGDIFTLAGDIRITGIGFGSGAGSQIQNGSTIQPAMNYSVFIDVKNQNPTGAVAALNMLNIGTTDTGIYTTGTGTVNIVADSIAIQTTGTLPPVINAGTSTVFIHPKTPGTNIDIGSTAGVAVAGELDLGDNELDQITAGTIQIGDANTGTIHISNVISPKAYKTLALAKDAAFTTGATTGGFDADVFSATDYEKITVAGAMTIDPAATLTVTAQGGYVPAPSATFTIINNTSAAATTGTFAGKPEGSIVPVGGTNETITYQGGTGSNDVVLLSTAVSVATTGSSSISEAAGPGSHLTYTFTRTGDLSGALTVNFSAGGNASFANDYTVGGADAFSTTTGLGTVTFLAGSNTATITLTPTNDTLVEGDESAFIFVNTGSGYGVGTSPAVGTITDNDTATVSFEFLTSNAPEAVTPHTVGVKLTTVGNGVVGAGSLQNNFTVYVHDNGGGTATPGGVDYTFTEQSLTFSAGDSGSTKTVSAAIVNDTISEGDETFHLGLSATPSQSAPGIFSVSPVTIDQNPHTVTILDNDIDLKVTASGPVNPVIAGSGPGILSLTFTVQNTGLVDATNINLSEMLTLPAGVTFFSDGESAGTFTPTSPTTGTWSIPAVAKNGTATLTLNFTADHTTANNAVASATGTAVSADQTLANTTDDSASAMGQIIRQSDLVLTKTDSADPVGPGAQLTYTITVHNSGLSDNTLAHITDTLPAGFSNATWTSTINGSAGPNGTGNVDADFQGIAANGDLIITVTGTVTAASNTTLSNTATLTSSEDTDGSNNSDTETTFVGGVDLILGKTSDHANAVPGDLIKYTLSYRNGGFITASGAKITDLIPSNTTFDLANSTAGWTDAMGNALANGATGSAVFPLGSVAVSETGATVILAVHVNSAVTAGAATVDNSAHIADDGAGGTDLTPSDNDASASSTLNAAPDFALTATKHVYSPTLHPVPNGDTFNEVARGQFIQYSYSYSNNGNQDATNAVITATVPRGASFNSGLSDARWSQTGPDTYAIDFETLAAGETGSVLFVVHIDQARALNPTPVKSIDSTASIDDGGTNGADPTPLNNTATTHTTLFEGLYAVSNSRQGGAVGAGSPPVIRVFDVTTGDEAQKITAYESNYRDGVRVAIGDVNGDGFVDIVTATRNGGGRIRVFDGLTHERLSIGENSQINAFTGKDAHGAYLALTDVNNDGRLDIIAGAGLGASGHVKVFDGVSGQQIEDVTPFGAGYKGGIRVAGGDVNGDGLGDVIAGQGQLGSKVSVYFSNAGEGFTTRALNSTPIQFTAGAAHLRDGVFLAAADETGDGIAEIIVGRGKAGNPGGASVGIFKFGFEKPTFTLGGTFTEIKTIPLSGSAYTYGARVAATDVNFDGIADILVGSSHLGGSKVQILDGTTGNELDQFTAFPANPKLGVFVAAGTAPIPSRLL